MSLSRQALLVVTLAVFVAACAASSASSPAPTRPPAFASDAGEADWWIDPSALPLSPTTSTIHGFLRERACASGTSPEGRILGPWIDYSATSVIVTYRVRTIGGRCPGNPAFPITIVLTEELGTRGIFDGGVDPPRDVTEDPNVVHEPSVDCGPLVGTNDAKIACMALESAALGDNLARFAIFRVAHSDKPCDAAVCTTAAGIEARLWMVEATDLDGAAYTWSCSYRAEAATCSPA